MTLNVFQLGAYGAVKAQAADLYDKAADKIVINGDGEFHFLAEMAGEEGAQAFFLLGRKFGGRDHSTVIHAVRLIEDLRQRDADMDGDVRSLLRQLES